MYEAKHIEPEILVLSGGRSLSDIYAYTDMCATSEKCLIYLPKQFVSLNIEIILYYERI